MEQPSVNAAREAILEQLQRAALETYAEERCAEAPLQNALNLAATALWRVSQERLEPQNFEPTAAAHA